MNFTKTLQHTLRFEGGYACDPDDRGGETFRGISRQNWPAWAGWPLIDAAKGQGLQGRQAIDDFFAQNEEMQAKVADFYREYFWRPVENLALPPRATAKVFDTAVNTGIGRAIKLLQESLKALGAKVAVDGKYGPQSLAAVQEFLAGAEAEARFLAEFAQQQAAFYRAVAAKNPRQGKFLNGWLRRAAWAPQ